MSGANLLTEGLPQFWPGVAVDHVIQRLRATGGKEIETGKFMSPQSSAALAVNAFGWFIERPEMLPKVRGLGSVGVPLNVDDEYCARFPWRGGRHPWLDAMVRTDTHLIGVESKRYEPYRDRKSVSFSDAYDRPVWGDKMAPFERMRDQLRGGDVRFGFLDAAQLVKHAFGLVSDARRKSLAAALLYISYREWLADWTSCEPEVATHGRAIIEAFQP